MNLLRLFYGRGRETVWPLELISEIEKKKKEKTAAAKFVKSEEINTEQKSYWKGITSNNGQSRNI